MTRPWAMRVAVLAGGMAGSLARYLVQSAADVDSFPWGTLLVNILGAFLLGVLTSRAERLRRPELTAALVGVGGLGAFTTFSALVGQVDAMALPGAIVYASVSVALGLAAAVSGVRLGRARA